MPTSLTNVSPSATYSQLLHVDGGVTGEEKTVHDGDGTPTAFKVGTQSASVDNIQIDGNTIRSTNPNGDINIEPNGNGITRLKRLNVTGGIVADTFSITGGGSFLGIEGIASTAEAQAGTNNSKVITPLRLREGLVPMVASTAEAQGGTDNTKIITPLRLREGLVPMVASTAEAQGGTDNTKIITPLRLREGFNAPGSAPVYACRAWVNFNDIGTGAPIRASGNVSSITRHSLFDYTVNFATAMPDANYSFLVSAKSTSWDLSGPVSNSAAPTTTNLRFQVARDSGGAVWPANHMTVAIFR